MKRLEGWKGHPLRKDYPLGGEDVAFTYNKDEIDEQKLPYVIEGRTDGYMEFTPDGLTLTSLERLGLSAGTGKIILNMGPQHPSMHGLLRLVMEMEGEKVLNVLPEIGYLHTGIEKSGEFLTYPQALTLTDRADYLSNLFNNLAYSMAVEKILGLEIPPRAQYIRVLLCELNRLSSHLLAVGTLAFDLGAVTVLQHGFGVADFVFFKWVVLPNLCPFSSYIMIGG